VNAAYDMTDGGRLTKTAQVRLIGNSVSPPVAAAVIRAQFPIRRRAAA
jgi:DNA (cytosine-5)-methyltransferase 1